MPMSLKQSVEEALQAYSPLRTSRAEISVTANNGTVTLSGYVPSSSIKGMATILANSVANVNEVENDLIADPELDRRVALALAGDDRTRSLAIRVRSKLGYVQLQGQVPSKEAMEIALEVAREVEGPKEIANALKFKESKPLAA
jgi:osmotically-inducible protein OsmY